MTTSDFTNTLIFTNLPKDAFLEANFLLLKSSIETYGPVMNYAPIKSFSRLLVSFENIEHALQCRTDLNGTIFLGEKMKIYFAEYNYTTSDGTEHMLKLPENDKLWLVSPPGSPPVGWLQEREEPPNDATLAEDLLQALRKLVDNKEDMEASDDSSLHSNFSNQVSEQEFVLSIQAGNGEDDLLPAITVQDYEQPKNQNSSREIASDTACQLLFDPSKPRQESLIPRTSLPPPLLR